MGNSNLTSLKNQNRFLISQSNDLVEAHYSPELTTRAHKIARLILSLIKPDDQNLRTYTIRLDSLKEYIGMNNNTHWGAFYDRLKETAKKLNENPIEIRKSNNKYLVAYFLSGYEIDSSKGTVTFEISGLLKPYLLQIKKNYTSYLLHHIPKLRSGYSIRLYELLHQYRKIGKRIFELEDLQKKVGSNYKAYADCKRKVILQAQRDLKKHTDLAFAFNEHKTGRKVTSIEFIIFGNKPVKDDPIQPSLLDGLIETEEPQEPPAFNEIIIQSMNRLGISEQNIAKYLARGFEVITDKEKKKSAIERCKTLENYYLEKLELTKHSADRNNAAGYFIKALKEDWVTSQTQKKAKAKTAANNLLQAKKELALLSNQIIKLSKQKNAIKEPIIEKLIKDDGLFEKAYQHTVEELGSFMKKHYADILHLPTRQQYEQATFVKSGVAVYLIENHPQEFKAVTKIDEQIKQAQAALQAIKDRHPTLTNSY